MDTSREEAKKWFTKEAYEENEMDELASQLIHAGCAILKLKDKLI